MNEQLLDNVKMIGNRALTEQKKLCLTWDSNSAHWDLNSAI